MSADQLEHLLTAVGAAPALPGARCSGRHALFDGDDGTVDDRTRQAVALCRRCPALSACKAWADRQPPRHLDGVVAGRLFVWAGTTGRCRVIDVEPDA